MFVVDWTHGAQHMWDNHKVAVVEANEAGGDVDAVWFDPDPSSRSSRSVRVIGYSRRAILTVILVHRGKGAYYGANGWSPIRRTSGGTERAVMDAKQEVGRAQAESEATRDEPLPEHVKGERRGRSVVQSVRLPAEAFAVIEEIAARADVPVSALIRGWVLQGLATEQGTSLRDGIERLAADADRLRRLAAAGEVA